MLLVTLNGAFATGFLFFAMRALQRGWPFLRAGWTAIRVQVAHPDFRQNIERRRIISEGGIFLLGGVLWLAASVIALLVGGYFSWQTFLLLTHPV
jgi:hypothetical protein